MSYRDKLYGHYTAHPSHETADLGPEQDAVFRHHMRGWLPSSRELPVLDLGCGAGELLGFLGREGYRKVVGVDRSEPQIERARVKVPQAEIILGDALELLRNRPTTFSAVLCFDVLEHLDRDELFDLVELVHAALAPGGSLIARVPNADSPFHDVVRYGDLTHETGLSPRSLHHLFAVAGYGEIEPRECDPVARTAKSRVRAFAWRLLRQSIRAWNLVETGSAGSGIYTRVMMVRAKRL